LKPRRHDIRDDYRASPVHSESVFEIAATANRHNLQVPDAAIPELRDLIVGMLATDPSAQMSMDDVADYLWLTRTQKWEFRIEAVAP
jgi:hypothetical protein